MKRFLVTFDRRDSAACSRATRNLCNRLRRFLQLLTLALTWSVLPSPPPMHASNTAHDPQLFVLTTFSNSVTVIDSATDQITTKIPVGQSPVRLAMTPDGLKAYVSDTASNTVCVIDTLNRIVTATIPTGHNGPQEITVTPDDPNEFEYPFPDEGNARLYKEYRDRAGTIPNLLICGRLGEYRYYDMDQAIARAQLLARKLLAGSLTTAE